MRKEVFPAVYLLFMVGAFVQAETVTDDVPAAPPNSVEFTNDMAPSTEAPVIPSVTTPSNASPPEAGSELRPRIKGSELVPVFDASKKSQHGITASRRGVKMPRSKEKSKREDGWQFSLELGSDTMRGNKSRDRYTVSFEGEKEKQDNYFWLRARRRYGKSGEEKDVDESQLDVRAEHMISERNYVAADTLLQQDRISAITYRLRANISIGRFFISKTKTLFGAEVGPGWIQEKKGDEVNGYAAGRLKARFERLLMENILFSATGEFIQSAEDSKVYFLSGVAGLRVAISSSLKLEVSIEDRYDNAPAEGKEKNDWFTSTSLRWQF